MLTVLVRHKNSGVESIYQAESVDYVPINPESGESSAHVILNGEGLGRNIELIMDDPQRIFVMNEAGQTVARYNL